MNTVLAPFSQPAIVNSDAAANAPADWPIFGPSNMTSVLGSVAHAGHGQIPSELSLKAAFGELKLDLREAHFPDWPIVLVIESLCASVEVRLPAGATVLDHASVVMSSHKVLAATEGAGPMVLLDGWSVCSDVKVLSY